MPVVTRSQSKLMAMKTAKMFKVTIEDPCILRIILDKLNKRDVANMMLVSKDAQFNDVVDWKLQRLLEEKKKHDNVTETLQNYLNNVANTEGKDNKIDLVAELFQYLCNNRWYIYKHKKFSKVVYNKVFEFMEEHYESKKLMQCLVKYLVDVCDFKSPAEYYDSQTNKARYGSFDKEGKFVDIPKF